MKKIWRLFVSLCLVVLSFSIAGCFFTEENSNKSNNSNTVYYLGETATNSKNVDFTVTSIKDTTKIGYNETENNFIILTIRIKNNGNESWEQNPNNCVLLCNGAKYEYNSATYSLADSMSSFTEINPGISKTMSIAFETPNKSTESDYSVKLEGYSFWKDDSVTIKLQERK